MGDPVKQSLLYIMDISVRTMVLSFWTFACFIAVMSIGIMLIDNGYTDTHGEAFEKVFIYGIAIISLNTDLIQGLLFNGPPEFFDGQIDLAKGIGSWFFIFATISALAKMILKKGSPEVSANTSIMRQFKWVGAIVLLSLFPHAITGHWIPFLAITFVWFILIPFGLVSIAISTSLNRSLVNRLRH